MKKFFTADHHFNHANIIKHCKATRGMFDNVEEMNETLIQNWNSMIDKRDCVYHLGDFAFGNTDKIESILKRLNGRIRLIMGNHDDYDKIYRLRHYFDAIYQGVIFKKKWTLTHKRIIGELDEDMFYLHGHSHGTLPNTQNCFDVGVDTHNLFPYDEEEIETMIKENQHVLR